MKIRSTHEINRRASKGIFHRIYVWLRNLVVLSVLAYVIYLFIPVGPPLRETPKRFVILGFDGADPNLIKQWWDDLPNLKKLAEQGTFSTLETTTPAESPVSWSSFAVGANPGRHGVFDFLRRPVGSYMPTPEAFVERKYPKFIFDAIPVRMPKAVLRRGGIAFWDVASRAGIPTSLIEVPVTFPPPKLNYGRSLSGLGVPDVRGNQATFHQFIYKQDDDGTVNRETTFGGKIKSVTKEGELYTSEIEGPRNPVQEQALREYQSKLMTLWLDMHEWMSHIRSRQGVENAGEDAFRLLEMDFKQTVAEPYALSPYMHTTDLTVRINAVKEFLLRRGEYTKEEGKSINDARIAQAKINEEINQLAEAKPKVDTVTQEIQFQIDGGSVVISMNDESEKVALDSWSGWFHPKFHVNSLITVHGVCRFYIQSNRPDELRVFMTSPDIDPENPAIPISYPASFSKELVQWTGGLYKTRGWAAETHGLKDGSLDEDAFIEDLFSIMDMRERKTFETWKRTKNNLFVSVFSSTDRASHMFYHHIDKEHPMYDPEQAEKYGDVIKKVYMRMDSIVGRMMEEVGNDENTVLMVVSDHGFLPMRYQVNLNTWLLMNGFLQLRGNKLLSKEMKLEDLLNSDSSTYFNYVDWFNTKAYALGLGQIYINLEGREPLGAVAPGDYEKVCQEIKEKLVTLTDPRWQQYGEPVVEYVKSRDEMWEGVYASDTFDAPDLQVGFKPGYRISWQTCLGGITSEDRLIENNMEKWSGDHCSVASMYVNGIFFCNRKVANENPRIIDIAPTVVDYFELDKPEMMEGVNLFN